LTDRYAVIGNPVEHSKSPLIHAAFARQASQDIEYGKVLAPVDIPDGFSQKVDQLVAEGYKGANVTVPFKFQAFGKAHERSDRAEMARAVNTLSFRDGKIFGDNTDGVGLVTDITQNLKFSIAGKRVLLAGAGGAGWGVLLPLLQQNPRLLIVGGRDIAKAEELSEAARSLLDSVDAAKNTDTVFYARKFTELAGQKFDLVINSTSSGLSNAYPDGLPEDIFAEGALAYDMMYGRETPFMRVAREQGAQVADGLGMLVEQAAEAFYIWRGVRPDTAPVIASLRA
jgi:shikimate dehydrogenase